MKIFLLFIFLDLVNSNPVSTSLKNLTSWKTIHNSFSYKGDLHIATSTVSVSLSFNIYEHSHDLGKLLNHVKTLSEKIVAECKSNETKQSILASFHHIMTEATTEKQLYDLVFDELEWLQEQNKNKRQKRDIVSSIGMLILGYDSYAKTKELKLIGKNTEILSKNLIVIDDALKNMTKFINEEKEKTYSYLYAQAVVSSLTQHTSYIIHKAKSYRVFFQNLLRNRLTIDVLPLQHHRSIVTQIHSHLESEDLRWLDKSFYNIPFFVNITRNILNVTCYLNTANSYVPAFHAFITSDAVFQAGELFFSVDGDEHMIGISEDKKKFVSLSPAALIHCIFKHGMYICPHVRKYDINSSNSCAVNRFLSNVTRILDTCNLEHLPQKRLNWLLTSHSHYRYYGNDRPAPALTVICGGANRSVTHDVIPVRKDCIYRHNNSVYVSPNHLEFQVTYHLNFEEHINEEELSKPTKIKLLKLRHPEIHEIKESDYSYWTPMQDNYTAVLIVAVAIAVIASLSVLICLCKNRHVLKDLAKATQPELCIEELLPEIYDGLLEIHAEKMKKKKEEQTTRDETKKLEHEFDVMPL